MEKLAEKLAGETGRKIEIMTADLTEPRRCGRSGAVPAGRSPSNHACEQRRCGRHGAAYWIRTPAEMSRMIALNVEAVTQLTSCRSAQGS